MVQKNPGVGEPPREVLEIEMGKLDKRHEKLESQVALLGARKSELEKNLRECNARRNQVQSATELPIITMMIKTYQSALERAFKKLESLQKEVSVPEAPPQVDGWDDTTPKEVPVLLDRVKKRKQASTPPPVPAESEEHHETDTYADAVAEAADVGVTEDEPQKIEAVDHDFLDKISSLRTDLAELDAGEDSVLSSELKAIKADLKHFNETFDDEDTTAASSRVDGLKERVATLKEKIAVQKKQADASRVSASTESASTVHDAAPKRTDAEIEMDEIQKNFDSSIMYRLLRTSNGSLMYKGAKEQYPITEVKLSGKPWLTVDIHPGEKGQIRIGKKATAEFVDAQIVKEESRFAGTVAPAATEARPVENKQEVIVLDTAEKQFDALSRGFAPHVMANMFVDPKKANGLVYSLDGKDYPLRVEAASDYSHVVMLLDMRDWQPWLRVESGAGVDDIAALIHERVGMPVSPKEMPGNVAEEQGKRAEAPTQITNDMLVRELIETVATGEALERIFETFFDETKNRDEKISVCRALIDAVPEEAREALMKKMHYRMNSFDEVVAIWRNNVAEQMYDGIAAGIRQAEFAEQEKRQADSMAAKDWKQRAKEAVVQYAPAAAVGVAFAVAGSGVGAAVSGTLITRIWSSWRKDRQQKEQTPESGAAIRAAFKIKWLATAKERMSAYAIAALETAGDRTFGQPVSDLLLHARAMRTYAEQMNTVAETTGDAKDKAAALTALSEYLQAELAFRNARGLAELPYDFSDVSAAKHWSNEIKESFKNGKLRELWQHDEQWQKRVAGHFIAASVAGTVGWAITSTHAATFVARSGVRAVTGFTGGAVRGAFAESYEGADSEAVAVQRLLEQLGKNEVLNITLSTYLEERLGHAPDKTLMERVKNSLSTGVKYAATAVTLGAIFEGLRHLGVMGFNRASHMMELGRVQSAPDHLPPLGSGKSGTPIAEGETLRQASAVSQDREVPGSHPAYARTESIPAQESTASEAPRWVRAEVPSDENRPDAVSSADRDAGFVPSARPDGGSASATALHPKWPSIRAPGEGAPGMPRGSEPVISRSGSQAASVSSPELPVRGGGSMMSVEEPSGMSHPRVKNNGDMLMTPRRGSGGGGVESAVAATGTETDTVGAEDSGAVAPGSKKPLLEDPFSDAQAKRFAREAAFIEQVKADQAAGLPKDISLSGDDLNGNKQLHKTGKFVNVTDGRGITRIYAEYRGPDGDVLIRLTDHSVIGEVSGAHLGSVRVDDDGDFYFEKHDGVVNEPTAKVKNITQLILDHGKLRAEFPYSGERYNALPERIVTDHDTLLVKTDMNKDGVPYYLPANHPSGVPVPAYDRYGHVIGQIGVKGQWESYKGADTFEGIKGVLGKEHFSDFDNISVATVPDAKGKWYVAELDIHHHLGTKDIVTTLFPKGVNEDIARAVADGKSGVHTQAERIALLDQAYDELQKTGKQNSPIGQAIHAEVLESMDTLAKSVPHATAPEDLFDHKVLERHGFDRMASADTWAEWDDQIDKHYSGDDKKILTNYLHVLELRGKIYGNPVQLDHVLGIAGVAPEDLREEGVREAVARIKDEYRDVQNILAREIKKGASLDQINKLLADYKLNPAVVLENTETQGMTQKDFEKFIRAEGKGFLRRPDMLGNILEDLNATHATLGAHSREALDTYRKIVKDVIPPGTRVIEKIETP